MAQNMDNLLMQVQDDASGYNLNQIAKNNSGFLFPFQGNLISAQDAQAILAQQQMRQQQMAEEAAQNAKSADPLAGAPLWMKQERADKKASADLAQVSTEMEAWRAKNIDNSIPTEEGTISNWKFKDKSNLTPEQQQASTSEGVTVGRNDKELYLEQMMKDQRQQEVAVANAKNKGNKTQGQYKPTDILKPFMDMINGGMSDADAWANIDKAFGVGSTSVTGTVQNQTPTAVSATQQAQAPESFDAMLEQAVDPSKLQQVRAMPMSQQVQIVEAWKARRQSQQG